MLKKAVYNRVDFLKLNNLPPRLRIWAEDTELEDFVRDEAFYHKDLPRKAPMALEPLKVAVIGSGPAGLGCADQLRRLGYDVTIFERDDRPGIIICCCRCPCRFGLLVLHRFKHFVSLEELHHFHHFVVVNHCNNLHIKIFFIFQRLVASGTANRLPQRKSFVKFRKYEFLVCLSEVVWGWQKPHG